MEDSNAFTIRSRVLTLRSWGRQHLTCTKIFGSVYSTRRLINPEYWNIRQHHCKDLISTISFCFQERLLVSACYLSHRLSWLEWSATCKRSLLKCQPELSFLILRHAASHPKNYAYLWWEVMMSVELASFSSRQYVSSCVHIAAPVFYSGETSPATGKFILSS